MPTRSGLLKALSNFGSHDFAHFEMLKPFSISRRREGARPCCAAVPQPRSIYQVGLRTCA